MPKWDVFLSFTGEDTAAIDAIDDVLSKGRGLRCWRYDQHLEGGTRTPEKVEAALADSSVLLVYLSPDSMSRDWVKSEAESAQSHRKPIIPASGRHLADPLPEGWSVRLGAKERIALGEPPDKGRLAELARSAWREVGRAESPDVYVEIEQLRKAADFDQRISLTPNPLSLSAPGPQHQWDDPPGVPALGDFVIDVRVGVPPGTRGMGAGVEYVESTGARHVGFRVDGRGAAHLRDGPRDADVVSRDCAGSLRGPGLYDLTCVRRGHEFRLLVNGRHIGTWHDPRVWFGLPRLVAYVGARAQFSDLRVTGRDVSGALRKAAAECDEKRPERARGILEGLLALPGRD